ncbi:hypothetical protein I8H89_05075 [Candidatus Saccharibacteria bacterium]|nr:hypothetical protein [Candidatus Saccharibacteria bacterium]
MEFLKASRRKSLLSEMLHAVLNIALATAIFVLVFVGSTPLALALVLVSKWRILAVRPRYWWANILANIVDLAVSLSTVVLLYLAGTSGLYGLTLQVAIAALYAVWLIAIKPRSSQRWIVAQAGVSLFIGVWAVMAISYVLPLAVVVLAIYVIGYGAARHVLVSREEDQPSLLAMLFGLFVAEIAWVSYHWTVAYGTSILGELKLPQVTLVISLVGFLAVRLYSIHASGRSLRSAEAVAPSIFVSVVILVLVLFFSAGAGII